MAKTKKQRGKFEKIGQWFYKNSITYRLLRKAFKSVYGKLFFALIILLALSYLMLYKVSENEIHKTLILWKDSINSKAFSKLEAISDYSQNNPYRITLPDRKFVETGNFFINSIDPEDTDLNISLKNSDCLVKINYHQENNSGEFRMLFKLKRVSGGWKIFSIEVKNQ